MLFCDRRRDGEDRNAANIGLYFRISKEIEDKTRLHIICSQYNVS